MLLNITQYYDANKSIIASLLYKDPLHYITAA